MNRVAVVLLACLLAVTVAPAAGQGPDLPFRVARLTERVTVFTELSPWESNHVVITTRGGPVLVDPGHTPLMGRLIRRAVARELGIDRFAYVIDTHGHWGHTWGNAAFPEAVILGHDSVVTEMTADAANLGRRLQAIHGQTEQVEAQLAELPPGSDERPQVELQKQHLERIARGLAEPGLVVQPPQLTFSDRLRLDLGDVTLEMAYLGRGHSGSDIVVVVPEERVALIGCFFLEQGPLPVFGTQPVLDPDRWIEVFDAILAREPAVEHVVLGQHSVWTRGRFAEMRDAIASLWSEVRRVDAEGLDLETALDRSALPPALAVLGAAGATEQDLARYHRVELTALWRQLKDSAAVEVGRAIDDGGAEAGVARYRELAERGGSRVFFDENEFNQLGYRLLGEGRVDEAIAVFELNVERFPDSWNVYDSLGEACATHGDSERAISLYRRSVELNPANTNGLAWLDRLRGGE